VQCVPKGSRPVEKAMEIATAVPARGSYLALESHSNLV